MMEQGLTELTEHFIGKRVLVAGDVNLDTYIEGTTTRLCREAPVPVVEVTGRRDVPGQAANTAVNLRKMGADVVLVSVVGRDRAGDVLTDAISREGVKTLLSAEDGRKTILKSRYRADSQLLARFDEGVSRPLLPETEARIAELLSDLAPDVDALVLSDYDGDVITRAVRGAIHASTERGPAIVVDSRKRLPFFAPLHPLAVKPNFAETCALLGVKSLTDVERVDFALKAGPKVRELCRADIAAITLDKEGALIFERSQEAFRTFSRPVSNSRAAGAGDTFLSAFTLAIACGASGAQAGTIASAAASVVVSQEGTVACSLAELVMALSESTKVLSSAHEAEIRAALYRKQGKRVVFTNGYFDIVHAGSIASLNGSKELGDVLFVGINSDESIGRLKGPGRPIHSLSDRVRVLAALECVDHVVPFNGDTASGLIEAIKPEIYAKGGNYDLNLLPEVPIVERLGGEIVLLPYMGESSTAGIIERIRRGKGAEQPLVQKEAGVVARAGGERS